MKKTGLFCMLVLSSLGLCLGTSVAQDSSGDPLTEVFKKDAPPEKSLLPDGVAVSEEYRPAKSDPIGSVAAITGRVYAIHRNGDTAYVLQKKAPLFSNDMLVTGEKGRIHLKFEDGSFIHMGSHTKLELDHATYDPSKKTRDSLISVLFGKARFIITKLAEFRDARFNVKTPTAVAGVRGSDFAVAVDFGSPLVTTLMTGKDTTVIFSGDKPPAQVVGPMSVSSSAAGAAPTPPAGISVYDVSPFEIGGVPNWVYWTSGGAAAIAAGAVALSGDGGGGSDPLTVENVNPPEGSTIFGLVDTDITFLFSEDINPATPANVNLITTGLWSINSVTNSDSRTVVVQVTNPNSIPIDGFTLQFSNITSAEDGQALTGQTDFFFSN